MSEPVPAKRKEIKVTPEMIEAGVEAYIDGDEYFEGRADIVERIFKRMMAARSRAGRRPW